MKTGKELTILSQSLQSDLFKGYKNGLIIVGKPSEKECLRVAQKMCQMQEAIQWWLGDLCIYYDGHYGSYKKFAQDLGLHPGTLYNYKWVASAYPISSRDETLTWHHYRLAIKWQDRDYWLNKAGEKSWSANQMEAARKKQIGWDRARFNEFESNAAEMFNIGDRLLQQYKEDRTPYRNEFEELIQKLLYEVEGLKFEASITKYRYPLKPLTRKDFELEPEEE